MLEPTKKNFMILLTVALSGVLLFASGLLLIDGNLVAIVVGMVVFVGAGKFLIAYAYKAKTGRDTTGARFWKWVFNVKDR